MKRLKKVKSFLLLWLLAYPLWLVSGVFYLILRLLRVVVIHHQNKIPFWPKSLVIASNHPSMWEPVIYLYLFFLRSILNPAKFIPYSTPDLKNYNKWYWELVKARFIFIARNCTRSIIAAFKMMLKVLKRGGIIIIFPEGGRTATNKEGYWLYSKFGHRLRPLKEGAAKLALEADSEILIIWVNGSDQAMPVGRFWPKLWKRTDVYIGPTIKLSGDYRNDDDVKKGTEQIAQALLDLADETGPPK